jgi:steroid 5-alpha reductase family enzyme
MKIVQLLLACCVFVFAFLSVFSAGSPWLFLAAGDPFQVSSVVCGGIIAACFVLAWITGDYSQTDRLWSITPVLYAWYFAARGHFDGRLVLMASLATLWGARLSFNFARKGGYTTEEDYRWIYLKNKISNPAAWQVFNLTFIAGYQHIQVLLITLPACAVLMEGTDPLGLPDLCIALLFLSLLAVETISDEQMWRFQQEKKRKTAAGEALDGDFKKGFITSGLYSLSRHPNYFAEISIWWAFYLFIPAATGAWLHWAVIGAVSLTILFQGSVWFTESISAGKYSAYADYRRRVSRLLPWFAGYSKEE